MSPQPTSSVLVSWTDDSVGSFLESDSGESWGEKKLALAFLLIILLPELFSFALVDLSHISPSSFVFLEMSTLRSSIMCLT